MNLDRSEPSRSDTYSANTALREARRAPWVRGPVWTPLRPIWAAHAHFREVTPIVWGVAALHVIHTDRVRRIFEL